MTHRTPLRGGVTINSDQRGLRSNTIHTNDESYVNILLAPSFNRWAVRGPVSCCYPDGHIILKGLTLWSLWYRLKDPPQGRSTSRKPLDSSIKTLVTLHSWPVVSVEAAPVASVSAVPSRSAAVSSDCCLPWLRCGWEAAALPASPGHSGWSSAGSGLQERRTGVKLNPYCLSNI